MGIRLFAAGKLPNEPDSVTGKPKAELLHRLKKQIYFLLQILSEAFIMKAVARKGRERI
jgi:hypothetical protein